MRTYERGVEAETGACGTGAISTSLAAVLKKEISLPVVVIPPSKSKLQIDIVGDSTDSFEFVTLKGSAEIIGESEVDIPV